MSELKVGLLAIATVIAVVFMSLKITSNQSGFGDYVAYRSIIDDASGIFPKTPIKVAGINAGRIKKIELQGNKALIRFEILERVKITTDSLLKIKTVGFLGDKYLEIVINQSSETRMPENEFMASEAASGFENLAKDASEILKDVKKVVKKIQESLAPEGEISPIKKITNDFQKVASSLRRLINGNEDKIHKLIANLTKFSKDLAYHFDKNEPQSAMSDLKQLLKNANKMSSDLKDLIADVKGGRGTLGQFLAEDGIADEVKETLAGVQKIVGKVDAIRTELSLFTGANTDNGGTSDAALKIFPSPERFYILGLTTTEFGPIKEQETTTTVNGVRTVENKQQRDKDSFRFDVQVGRKIHNWSFRGGLIESTGGLGVDYSIEKWSTIFSLEAFDYRSDIGINLKLSSEVHMWNVFYGKVEAEDMVTSNSSFTLSAGLRFTDEDLKGLIGFFF